METKPRKGKILKSLTLPQTTSQDLESLAKTTGCKQADIVRIGISELKNLNDDELTKLLVEYQAY